MAANVCFSVRIPPQLKQRLDQEAAATGEPLNNVIRHILCAWAIEQDYGAREDDFAAVLQKTTKGDRNAKVTR